MFWLCPRDCFMLNHQAVNADCRFSDLGQLQWQSGFCTILLSLFCLFYAPPPLFLASQLFCNSGAMFIIRCTLMNDEILTSISNPIPADLCAYPLQHMYHSKRFWIKRGKLKRSFERLGHGILFVHSWICLDAWRPWTEGESDVSRVNYRGTIVEFSMGALL